jgi:hypothetical protein
MVEVFLHNHKCACQVVLKTHGAVPIDARGNPPTPMDYDNCPVPLKEGMFDMIIGPEIKRLLEIIGSKGYDATWSPFVHDNNGLTHNPFTNMSVLSLPCTKFGSQLVRTGGLLARHTVSAFLFVFPLSFHSNF